MSSDPPIDKRPIAEIIKTHEGFVRRLALSLTRDTHQADDLVQQTWVAALEQEPESIRAPRGWLAEVMRRHSGRAQRSQRRREQRERSAARSPNEPSVTDILEREALRRRVIDAVLGLDPVYRQVMLLRHFENLPPRSIAAQLNLPVETVRTRIKRASAALRAVLDAGDDKSAGRAGWVAALPLLTGETAAPAAGLATTGIISSTTLGSLIMASKLKLGAIAAALAIIGAIVWTALDSRPADLHQDLLEAPPHATGSGPEPDRGQPVQEEPLSPQDPVAQRATVGSAPEPVTESAHGSILARIVWKDDGTPIEGIRLFRRARSSGAREATLAFPERTDAHGESRLDSLPPGRYFVDSARATNGGAETIEVRAGEETLVEFSIPRGARVDGTVVDALGKGIAGATVLIARWGGQQCYAMAETDDDGRFCLQGITPSASIGARAPGYAPTAMQGLSSRDGSSVVLTISMDEPGGALRCLVLDPAGAPVADAVVSAGVEGRQNQPVPLPNGADGHVFPWRTRTDDRGRATFAGLQFGTIPLAVRTADHALWHGNVEISGRPAETTIRLERGVTIRGTVRDQHGAALAKALLQTSGAGLSYGHLGHQSRSSATDGSFEFRNLPTGTPIQLEVSLSGSGQHKSFDEAAPGTTLRWNPVIEQKSGLRGRVVDADGKPIEHAYVDCAETRLPTNTDEDGRFTLEGVGPGDTIRLSVRLMLFPILHRKRIVVGEEELEISIPRDHMPSIYVTGRLVDPDGKPVVDATVSPLRRDYGNSSPMPVEADGSFRLGPFPPGEYCAAVDSSGWAKIYTPYETIDVGGVLDVGTLRLERPGTLALQLIKPVDMQLPEWLRFRVSQASGRSAGRLRIENAAGELNGLPGGDYRLHVAGDGIASRVLDVRVESGRRTQLEVEISAGTTVAFDIVEPSLQVGEDGPPRASFAIEDRTGKKVYDGFTWRSRGRFWVSKLALDPGSYRVLVSDETRSGEARFEVRASAAEETVTVELR